MPRPFIILPNNGNIRMAAEAASNACEDKRVVVVPTKTVPQAFSALFAVMPDAGVDDVVEAMCDAYSEVRDGEVTRAVRDSSASDGSPIHSGDVMGIINCIDIVGSDVLQVTVDCINRMMDEEEGDSLHPRRRRAFGRCVPGRSSPSRRPSPTSRSIPPSWRAAAVSGHLLYRIRGQLHVDRR